MSRYEERLAGDRSEIRRRVGAVGKRVAQAVDDAVDALLAGDRARCYAVVLGDLPINREIRAIDARCHAFVARHLPSAGHLRFVSSVLQLNIALERIGDYAVTIAREAVKLMAPPPEAIARDMSELKSEATAILRQAVRAFEEQNVELARATKPQTKQVERHYADTFRRLTREGDELPLADAFALLMVFSRIERVSDQAKNLCEETVFELTGETKPPKRYNVLFVDARDTLIGPLAAALAKKAFPDSGHYDSAGFSAGDALAPEMEALATELSLDVDGVHPTPLDASRESLEKYHVIVCLTPDAEKHIPKIPYASALLTWKLPRLSEPGSESNVDARLRELRKHLVSEIRDLMVLLRGDSAD
jgi:phosphate transport system protein